VSRLLAVGENEAVSYAWAMGTLSHSPRRLSTIAGFFPSDAPTGKPSADYQRTAGNSAKNQQSVRQLDRFRGIAAAAPPADRAESCR